MNPMLRIRKDVLGLTQAEMAALADTTQATVSRWEKGGLEPDREHLSRIRAEAERRAIAWDDAWFFQVPDLPAHEAAA